MNNPVRNDELVEVPLFGEVDAAKLSAVVLLAVACLHVVVVYTFPPKNDLEGILIYVRNLSAVLTFLPIALFMALWSSFKSKQYYSRRIMKKIRTTSVLIISACVLKTLLSLLFAVLQFDLEDFEWVYYLGETFAWTVLTVFFIFFHRNRRSHHNDATNHHTHKATEEEIRMEQVAKGR